MRAKSPEDPAVNPFDKTSPFSPLSPKDTDPGRVYNQYETGGFGNGHYFRYKGEILIAELLGEVDHHGAAKARADIDETMAGYGSIDIIFDFSKVTFMDSSGIGIILGRYRKLSASGGRVAITGCSAAIRNILNMAGVFSIIDYMDSLDEAIEYLNRKEVS